MEIDDYNGQQAHLLQTWLTYEIGLAPQNRLLVIN